MTDQFEQREAWESYKGVHMDGHSFVCKETGRFAYRIVESTAELGGTDLVKVSGSLATSSAKDFEEIRASLKADAQEQAQAKIDARRRLEQKHFED